MILGGFGFLLGSSPSPPPCAHGKNLEGSGIRLDARHCSPMNVSLSLEVSRPQSRLGGSCPVYNEDSLSFRDQLTEDVLLARAVASTLVKKKVNLLQVKDTWASVGDDRHQPQAQRRRGPQGQVPG